jgi:hypothetical protein
MRHQGIPRVSRLSGAAPISASDWVLAQSQLRAKRKSNLVARWHLTHVLFPNVTGGVDAEMHRPVLVSREPCRSIALWRAGAPQQQ